MPPLTCLHHLLKQAEARAQDAYWNDWNEMGDCLSRLAASYRKRIEAGETHDVDF